MRAPYAPPPSLGCDGGADIDEVAHPVESDPPDLVVGCERLLEVEAPTPATARVRPLPYRDGYRRGTFDRWCYHRDRATGRCA